MLLNIMPEVLAKLMPKVMPELMPELMPPISVRFWLYLFPKGT